MALTRKFLAARGIDGQIIDEIIEAHLETVDALKEERDKFKADAQKLPEVTKERDQLKADADKADKDPFKVKYEAIKEEFENYKTEQTNRENAAKKSSAVKALLKEIGIADKRIDAVMRVTDTSKIQLDEDGKIKESGELKKQLKNEWSDFIVRTEEKGANVANPPASSGRGAKSKDEILKIKDTTERQKAWAEFLQNERN